MLKARWPPQAEDEKKKAAEAARAQREALGATPGRLFPAPTVKVFLRSLGC